MSNSQSGNARLVKEFYLAINTQLPEQPTLPDRDRLALHRTLVSEEYQECMAIFDHLLTDGSDSETHFVQLVHELVDLLYVAYGALNACGVEADELFAEIHRANMDKTKGPRREDGKLLKPAGWQPANLVDIIQRQREQGTDGAQA